MTEKMTENRKGQIVKFGPFGYKLFIKFTLSLFQHIHPFLQ